MSHTQSTSKMDYEEDIKKNKNKSSHGWFIASGGQGQLKDNDEL